MAGFFFAFAVDVAPAMAGLDAATYITVQQAINRVVRNALFGITYFGSALLPWVVVALALWAGQRRRAGAWVVIALAYGAAVFWVTRSLNVPINEALATEGMRFADRAAKPVEGRPSADRPDDEVDAPTG